MKVKTSKIKKKSSGLDRSDKLWKKALEKVAESVKAENKRWGLPLIVWRDGRVVSIPTSEC
jgi:hypothetical protein